MASALALRYSTNWAMKTSLEAGQFLEFILTGKKNETEDPSGQLRFYLSRQARLRTPFCFVIYMNDISKLLDQWYKNWDFEIIK